MNHDSYGDDWIAGILRSARRIALVGASDNPERPSYGVMAFLLANGHEVLPVNPGLAGQKILGQVVAATLADVAGPVQMIDIFRNPGAVAGVTREAIGLKDKLGIQVIWMQLGMRNDEAAREAEAAGLKVVMNRCPKIEYARLSGKTG
jgi:uncharacterized protein